MVGGERRGRKKTAERREGILSAALEEFLSAGYEAVTMGSIAERAGTSLATLYSYFSGKEDIAGVLVLDGLTQLGTSVLAAQAVAWDARQFVQHSVYAYMDWAAANPAWFRFLVKLARLTPAMTEPANAHTIDAATRDLHQRAIANIGGYLARTEMRRLADDRLYRPVVLGPAHFFLAFDWDGDSTSKAFAVARETFADAAWRAVAPDSPREE